MKIGVIFPKDSEALFDSTSQKTFGGASVQMFLIAWELIKQGGYNIICLVPRINNLDSRFAKWHLVEVFKNGNSIVRTILAFHKGIRKEKPDVLVQHGLTFFSCLLSVYCYFYGIKFVFMFAHDIEVEGKYQKSKRKCHFFQLLLRFGHILITQNKYQQDYLKNKGVFSKLIYMGFPLRTVQQKNRDIILWVARCESWKQPELFINFAKKHPQQKFTMICPKVEAKYFIEIKKLAAKVENLTFLDFVSFENMWEYFSRAKVFINTSKLEGFPQTFVQAAMCSVPIISLKVDPDELISKNECGYVCNNDQNLVSKKLRKLMTNDDIYNKFSQNARLYAQKNHNISDAVQKIAKSLIS